MEVWQQVHKELKVKPVASGHIGGTVPLYAERYLMQGLDRAVRGVDMLALITQFGGARVHEGEAGRWRTVTLPSQALLLPPNCATHWYYNGTTDFAVFYFTDPSAEVVSRLLMLTSGLSDPVQFSDSLVGAAALEILNEIAKGVYADNHFMEMLVGVMLEQVCRVLTAPKTGKLSPRYVHLARLQKILPYIREHLAEDLRAQTLADMAGVSVAHFRRLFQEALGIPLHRYTLNARLEQARKLLGTSDMPILNIAQECGFSSQSHLTASFKAVHAATPADYRANVRQERHGD